MNPFTESTVAQPLQGAAARWQARGAAPSQAGEAAGRGERASPMSRFLRRRPRSARPEARTQAQGGLKRLASQAVMTLGLALACSTQAWAVDVNRATPEELQAVRGIGPKTAQAIVDERARGGGFESFEDLSERVKGIGAKKAQSLQAAGLKLSTQAPAAEANTKKPAR